MPHIPRIGNIRASVVRRHVSNNRSGIVSTTATSAPSSALCAFPLDAYRFFPDQQLVARAHGFHQHKDGGLVLLAY
jgi:hypothetical protein